MDVTAGCLRIDVPVEIRSRMDVNPQYEAQSTRWMIPGAVCVHVSDYFMPLIFGTKQYNPSLR